MSTTEANAPRLTGGCCVPQWALPYWQVLRMAHSFSRAMNYFGGFGPRNLQDDAQEGIIHTDILYD